MDKGFTLIEMVVVIGILAVLALMGVESIVEFQKNALLEGTANELASTLRSARTKSISGELLPGETPAAFTVQGLPGYGVRIGNQNYILFREYELNHGRDDLQTFAVGSNLSLTPLGGEALFKRITGTTTSVTFTIQRNSGGETRQVEVNEKGVTVKK